MAELQAYGKENGANAYEVLGVLGVNYGKVARPVIGWLYRNYNPALGRQGRKCVVGSRPGFYDWCLQYADDDISDKDFDSFAEAKAVIKELR